MPMLPMSGSARTIGNEVKEAFRPLWEKVSGEEITVVVNRASNSILVKLPEPLWEKAKKILEEVDRAPLKRRP